MSRYREDMTDGRTCAHCGALLTRRPGGGRPRKTCSTKCRNLEKEQRGGYFKATLLFRLREARLLLKKYGHLLPS